MRFAILGLTLALIQGPAAAAECDGATRFAFVPTSGGALRLNTETGEVARCAATEAGAACSNLAPDARAGDADVARFEMRIAALEARIAELQGYEMTVPDDAAMERMMLLAERMMRRFLSLVRDMQGEAEGEDL